MGDGVKFETLKGVFKGKDDSIQLDAEGDRGRLGREGRSDFGAGGRIVRLDGTPVESFNVRAEREAVGYSVHDLAVRASFPERLIEKWERGDSTPSADQQQQLAAAMEGY
ncbi:MAG: helix-turn-helix transcriptional regulator [Actinomycetota bacterium]